VLDFVLKNYRYASLPELNAVLGQYNVRADCGKEDSKLRQNGGLVYGVLDEAGNRVGVPIKAGDFPGKPTLAFLQSKYAANDALRQPHKSRVRNAVDRTLSSGVRTLTDLQAALAKEGIGLLPRQNPEGVTYGLTYIDHTTRCVFNGSALGKAYSAKAVLERCNQSRQIAGKTETGSKPETLKAAALRSDGREHGEKTGSSENQPLGQKDSGNRGIVMEALDALLKPEHGHDYVPNSLKKRRRKKKKKRISNQP
ncbi:MAG: hypothetical protein MUD08_01840, partial [Cytophagales bacterium]|nr:hypothetical protein [Cytophagales bacterium]